VIAASNEWDDALYRNDLEALTLILADDFLTIQVARNGVAVVEKEPQLELLRRGGDARPRQRRKLDRVRVRMHGDTAILTAVATYGEAPAQTTRSVITEVWARTDGKWRLMHFQPTPAVRPTGR
jgi:ketosteroid isomerase-like protein